jgi:manganese/zinc/iron transport system substrate-binding protein
MSLSSHYSIRPLACLLAIALLTSGCTPKPRSPHEKLQIVTTTGMIQDVVQHVAGKQADVIALMGPGVDPHLYKATQGDVQKLSDADMVFYNGLHLEGKMVEVLRKLNRVKPVAAVADGIPENELRTVPGFQGSHDPHIWFNVHLWKQTVLQVSHTLQAQDTAHAAYYKANGERYAARLDSLHTAVQKTLAALPENQRVLITAHDAFGYFGDAYHVQVRGLQGISTMSEFGVRDVTELVNFIVSHKIKALFVETSVSSRSIEAVIEGCRQKGWPVAIGGNLYSDAMGAAGTPEGTYIGMIHANVNTIVNALK